ncbi:glycoside hydrolase family 25 protein [Paenibacillus koleovorans]|uniref:glycoside hydrolase family 25 protein n=1 Tax=Paenibacillus koleovorans TaxID=121608 RepID=UPI001FE77ABC|nr:glycoside hydrolase family 25 protein [Paenibacillus koleovorans]
MKVAWEPGVEHALRKIAVLLILLRGTLIVLLALLEFKGYIWHTSWFAKPYEVRGLDVSHYQGDIDWQRLRTSTDFQFVYIKATEGHDFIDFKFSSNWNKAKASGFLTGAYHFFSTRSSGAEQAQKYIEIVPKDSSNLPPVIDIEIDLNRNVDTIRSELIALSQTLERHYQRKPILYVTYATYDQYVSGSFEDHEIWIRDVLKHPNLKDGRDWAFWQYGNRGHVPGIDAYVDMNVFRGSQEAFDQTFKRS